MKPLNVRNVAKLYYMTLKMRFMLQNHRKWVPWGGRHGWRIWKSKTNDRFRDSWVISLSPAVTAWGKLVTSPRSAWKHSIVEEISKTELPDKGPAKNKIVSQSGCGLSRCPNSGFRQRYASGLATEGGISKTRHSMNWPPIGMPIMFTNIRSELLKRSGW